MIHDDDGLTFRGRYGQVLIRPESTTLALQDGDCLSAAGYTLESTGPAAILHVDAGGAMLTTEGAGEVTVKLPSAQHRIPCPKERQTRRL